MTHAGQAVFGLRSSLFTEVNSESGGDHEDKGYK
jgi:hypothetical protein